MLRVAASRESWGQRRAQRAASLPKVHCWKRAVALQLVAGRRGSHQGALLEVVAPSQSEAIPCSQLSITHLRLPISAELSILVTAARH